MYIVVGLGNPGKKYAHTRHNTGRMFLDYLKKKELVGIKLVHLDTFMNKSGPVVAQAMANKSAEKLIVVYDDLDLPLGNMKISYNRNSGGHRGVESIIQALKTQDFIRIRVGIGLPAGKVGKGEEVEKHILGKFKKSEMEILKQVFKRARCAIETIVEHGLARAMTEFNS